MWKYSMPIKSARLAIVRDAVAGGKLQLISTGSLLLAEVPLTDPTAIVIGDLLTFIGMPRYGKAMMPGVIASAKVVSDIGEVCIAGLSVSEQGGAGDVLVRSILVDPLSVVELVSMEIRHP